MPGYIRDENSLATGIPNRTIGPETGSSGNATMTNKGGTGQGTNQAHDSSPPPAAGIGASALTTSDLGEHHRSFESGAAGSARPDPLPESDIEPIYQQIADGGDHFDHHRRLHQDKGHGRRKDRNDDKRGES